MPIPLMPDVHLDVRRVAHDPQRAALLVAAGSSTYQLGSEYGYGPDTLTGHSGCVGAADEIKLIMDIDRHKDSGRLASYIERMAGRGFLLRDVDVEDIAVGRAVPDRPFPAGARTFPGVAYGNALYHLRNKLGVRNEQILLWRGRHADQATHHRNDSFSQGQERHVDVSVKIPRSPASVSGGISKSSTHTVTTHSDREDHLFAKLQSWELLVEVTNPLLEDIDFILRPAFDLDVPLGSREAAKAAIAIARLESAVDKCEEGKG